MADLEDVTLDGRPLQSLRVADLKAALEERGLSKSGQKNALVKRLKGALMLENLQRTSTAHIGLQPNSQIGEEMSQNSFIKQYLAKQQELLRQRLEREAREAYETNEQEDHSQVNNSTSCPPQAQQDAPGVLDEQHKPPGPSGGEELFDLENTREGNRDQEADLSLPPASGSVAMHGPGEHRPERCSASSEVTADSDDEDGEEDGDKDDWDSGARRGLQQPARVPTIRDRSGASCQPQQQHIPSLLSPQLRQPTPPPSPPPELSFPLPDTPKQSPPSPDVAPARRSSSSGSSSSDSCSSSPEPQRSGHAERKPGPLTLLARKMESEGAFSGAGWHVGDGEGDRQETSSPSTTLFTARSPLEGLVSAITHTASTISHLPMVPGNTQGVTGGHSAHIQVPMSVLKATAKNERDCELEREKAPELERQDPAEEVAWERILVLAGEESQKALGKEGIEKPHASEQEKLSKSRESQLAQEQERELALAKEREAQEQRLAQERALELERQKELEKQKALELEREKELERQQDLEKQVVLEQERLQREKREREEMEKERAKALEMERALEQDRIDRERALEAERKEKERIEREMQEMLEMERLERKKEREKALEQARLEKEIAFEQETIEKEKALKQERLAIEKGEMDLTEARTNMVQDMVRWEVKDMEERKAVLEQERMERERAENERKEHSEWEKAKEHENLERHEPLEKEQKEKEKEEERKLSIERRVEKEKVKQKEEQETEAEKERENHPPFKHGHELCPIPLPTPTLLSTGKARKLLAEAGEQNDAPVSRNEAESSAHMSPTPLSPQPSFKRSMFLRDSPIPPQSSSTSVVIKRPCAFSDQPQASPDLSLISFGEAQQERHQPSTKKEDPQMCRKDEFAAVAESVEIQSEKKDAVGAAFGQTTKEEGSTDVDLAKAEHGNESIKTTKEVDESRERGDARKEVKQRRQRSQSTDSSSESDSGSPSSQSSRSSTSSQENATFRSRGEETLKSDPSPWHSVTVEPQIKASEETSRASPRTRVTSAENSSRAADGNSPTKKPSIVDFPSEPTREEIQRKRKHSEEEEEKDKQRQVNETTMAQAEKSSETSEETPKVFSPRKISLSSTKSSPGTGSAESEQDSGAAGGRKRRWGSSTAVTAKKPSISITTDSLKSLIPDIRPPLGQEEVVDLHPEEAVLSEAEDEEPERTDQDLQIRRTVTQVVHPERQENGQKEAKRSRHEELEDEDTERTKVHEEKMGASFPGAVETQSHTSHDAEINTVTPSDTLIRRSISQQKTGVSITIDDPVRTSRQPSPPRGKVSNIVHICNLVRPFTLGQLKELLSRTGALVEEGFWIDRIKSHCYVTYSSSEEAVATRAALHGVKWPQSNPKVLCVDFSHQDELDFHKGLGTTDKHGAEEQGLVPGQGRTSGIPSLLPERDQWAEREREMERRERARAEREWDRDKIREFGKVEDKEGGPHRSCSRERRRKERGKSKEKKADKKEKTAEDPPAKLLDDLFRKTKAPPCIYWLPLTEEQYIQRQAARAERIKEREKRRKEQEEEEEKKKEEERQEKMKAGGSSIGDRGEGEKDKDRERGRDRERERERENDKRRDGYRRPGGSGAGGNRRSRSRSAPRERRR